MDEREIEARAHALAGREMPKLIARVTQEQVRDRIATSALEDERYMESLLSLAASRGVIYADAVRPMAEPVALIPQCEECNRIWLPHERDRWRCYLDDEDNLVFYCPDCAEREFDD